MNRNRHARALASAVSPSDHARGSPSAPVTLVAYGDFSNPDCVQTYRTVNKIRKKMGPRLRYVFRSFPEPREFANSEVAAEAAECAASQGRFWEMHDRMFDEHGTSDFQLSRHARELGLDLGRFRRELKGNVQLAKVRETRRGGVRSGVVSAPAFFI
ncbi:MAG: DsbA family protein, partial [Acidobacteriota bacterium]|nr:DsbA family protein [Acidobacteriota bacterium]